MRLFLGMEKNTNFFLNKLRWNKQIGAFFMGSFSCLWELVSNFPVYLIVFSCLSCVFARKQRKLLISREGKSFEGKCGRRGRENEKRFFWQDEMGNFLTPPRRKEVDCLEVSDSASNINHIFIFLQFFSTHKIGVSTSLGRRMMRWEGNVEFASAYTRVSSNWTKLEVLLKAYAGIGLSLLRS